MERKMIDLLYKVRGEFSPNGLQKVFCSFHPSDREQMEQISDDIRSLFNCAIYYHTDSFSEEEIDLEDYGLKLGEMKLFVVIVTMNFLMNDSLSRNWEYGFAIRHNIPVIPIMADPGLEEIFSTVMNQIGSGYGDIQFLKKHITDKTEISYQQKLRRDIGAVLIEDTVIERIKKAFSGQIFLSYRKKDRKYANELMRTIHNIPSLQNVSIWYDEFISTGEKWNDQIIDALKHSDVFLLMVTPSITEPDNFVIKKEYPSARKQNKSIISVRKTEVPDQEELERLFPGIKKLIDGDNTAELEEALKELASGGETDPEKAYLIGLAFFSGIEVERNSEKAVSLIIASAGSGFPDAINKLADMYWTGDGVPINYESSVSWRKKLVALYDRKYSEIKSQEELLNYVKALEKLMVCLYELSAFRESLAYGKQLISLIEQAALNQVSVMLSHYFAMAYDLCGKNCQRLGAYDDAILYAKKYHDLSRARYEAEPDTFNLHNLAVAYDRMGYVYYATGDLEQAEAWYLQACEIHTRIDGKLRSIESSRSLSESCIVLGDVYMRNSGYEKADTYYKQAVDLRKRILDAEESDTHLKEYGEALLAWGTSSLLEDNTGKAKELFFEAKDIMKQIADRYGTIEANHTYSVVLNRCGKICEAEGEFRDALEYYSEGLECRKRILSKIRTAEAVYEYTLALFFRAGIYRRLYDNTSGKKDYEEIVEKLLPILSKDRRGDWHRIFAESAFECFQMDTFSGKGYLQYAIDAWKWLCDRQPGNDRFHEQYELCRKMYQRCYPESIS